MILQEQIEKAAVQTTSSGLVFKVKHVLGSVAAAVDQHPGVAVVTGIGSSLVAVLQSAQEVVSTLIALATSIGGLIVAVMAVRAKWKNRGKE